MRVDGGILVALAAATAALVAEWGCVEGARTAGMRLCGRILSDVMSRVCSAYNSPAWDNPTVDRSAALTRRRRDVGIADQCCNNGCTWEQLNEFCAVSTNSESSLDALEAHLIADRSAEETTPRPPMTFPAGAGAGGGGGGGGVPDRSGRLGRGRVRGRGRGRGEVGRGRSGGYGRGAGDRGREHARTRGRRCWCRRKRRAGRRRSSLMEVRKQCAARCARGGHRVSTVELGSHTSRGATAA